VSEVESQEVEGQEAEPNPDAQPPEHSSGMAAAEEMEAAEEAEDQAAEPEPEPEPEPEGLSQKQLEQALGKLEKEAERHSKRVTEIMGSEVELLLTCPLCDRLTPGQIMPTPETPERFPAVREFMGDAQPAEYQQDPNTRTCQTCAGEGVVSTGSKVDGQAQLVCTDCGGKGWQGVRPAVATSGPMAAQPLPDANGQNEVTLQGPEPPEAAKLRALGYTLIQPVGT